MRIESAVTHQRPSAPSVDIAWSVHNRDLAVPLALPGALPGVAGVAQRRIVTLDGARLRLARKRAGLSQKELAAESGISAATVGKLERQPRARCHFRTRALIATALGAHPQSLTAAPDHGSGTAMAAVITAAPGEMASGPGWTYDQVPGTRRSGSAGARVPSFSAGGLPDGRRHPADLLRAGRQRDPPQRFSAARRSLHRPR
jgi:DNA-binding XRE family transcriptional regulator